MWPVADKCFVRASLCSTGDIEAILRSRSIIERNSHSLKRGIRGHIVRSLIGLGREMSVINIPTMADGLDAE